MQTQNAFEHRVYVGTIPGALRLRAARNHDGAASTEPTGRFRRQSRTGFIPKASTKPPGGHGGTDGQDDPEKVREFVDRYDIESPAVYQPSLGSTYQVSGYPTTYVLDGEGEIVAAHSG